jgi:hypothetical protein
MLRFVTGARARSKGAELMERNRWRVLLLHATLNSSYLLFDEGGLVGHHVAAAFRLRNDRCRGSVLVFARGRARHP